MIGVIGAAMTPQGRLEMGPGELAKSAVTQALADAEIDIGELGLIVVGNSMAGTLQDQAMIRGQSFLWELGLKSTPVVNVENGCSGGATAMHMGCLAVQGGTSPVLVLGVEKMWHEDRAVTSKGIEQGFPAELRETMRAKFATAETPSIPMGVNAVWAEEMMARGTTVEHMAIAASKAYTFGSLNPFAQRRTPITPQEVLDSRRISGVLTRYMCSSFTDGAAAVVISDSPPLTAPRVLASAMRSGDGSLEYHERLLETAELAWKIAGVGREDIDIIEHHDVTAAEEIYSLEELGFFGPGEAGPAIAEGRLSLGTDGMVSNPSGGLLARGHALGATGVCQVVELVQHLRGAAGARQVEGAKIGMAINTGGFIKRDTAAVGCHILAV